MLRITTFAVAATLVAGAASAQDARIAYGDLDLSTRSGAAELDARIDREADRVCRQARRAGSLLSDRAYCEQALRDAVLRQLPRQRQTDYSRASRTTLEV